MLQETTEVRNVFVSTIPSPLSIPATSVSQHSSFFGSFRQPFCSAVYICPPLPQLPRASASARAYVIHNRLKTHCKHFFSFVWFHLSNPKLCIAARWRNAATSKHFGPSPLIFLCVFRCIINYRMLKLERAKFRHLKIKLAFLSYLSQAGNDNKGHLNYTLQHWQMRIGGKERPGGCKEKAE